MHFVVFIIIFLFFVSSYIYLNANIVLSNLVQCKTWLHPIKVTKVLFQGEWSYLMVQKQYYKDHMEMEYWSLAGSGPTSEGSSLAGCLYSRLI